MTTATPDRIRAHRSLRAKTAASFAALTFLTTAVFGLVAIHSIQAAARQLTASQAIEILDAGAAGYEFTGALSPNLQLGSESIPKPLRAQIGPKSRAWDDGENTWAARRLPGGSVLATRLPDSSRSDDIRRLRATIVFLAATIAAASSLIGYVLATLLTSRLNRAAAHAAQLAQHPETAPPLDPELTRPGDEISALVVTADSATRSLAIALQQERTLTADAAHELRTPVAALIAAAELLPEGPDSERVRRVAARLERLVEDLLTLRRLQSRPADGPATTSLEDVARATADAEAPEHPVDLEVVAPTAATNSPELLGMALGNLIANAHLHGQPPVRVTVSGHSITVEDHGPGYPPGLLTEGPRRFHAHRSTGQTGLGLVIARNAAEAAGASLTLGNTRAGAKAVITVSTL